MIGVEKVCLRRIRATCVLCRLYEPERENKIPDMELEG